MNKKEARTLIKEKRMKLSQAYIDVASEKIFEKCSVSLLFLIFQPTRLMRGRSFSPTTE